MKKLKKMVLVSCSLLLSFNAHAQVDHSLLDQILKKHVSGGWVNYKKLHEGWSNANHPLKLYLKTIEKYTKKEVETWSQNDQKALYINAYNAYTLNLILDHYPLKSIRDLSSPWKRPIVKLMGETHHLDWIEHEVLRAIFKETRIHAAVNCASKSCPPLASFAFEGSKLDQQLNDIMKAFVNDSIRNQYNSSKKKASLSKIFKWYADDFKPSVREYLLTFAQGKAKETLQNSDVEIDYLDYDWSLNEISQK